MRLWDDERAVTVQIGAVLLLGFVVVAMSMYQATVVPQQNEEVEYDHNRQVHEEFVTLRGSIVESASEPTARPAAVSLGTRYPSRTFFVNPGPASGSLRSRSLGTLTVSNVSAVESGDTGDYVTGDNLSFTTSTLEYRPNYNVFRSAPTTVYENTVAYNRFDNGYNGTLTGQSLVNGRSISLVLLHGNYTANGVRRASVDAQATSPTTRTVAVTNSSAGGNVSVAVPTELSADDWRAMLEASGDYDPGRAGNESDGAFVYDVTGDGADGVRIVMERNATYDLRVGAVGVGPGVENPEPHYLTAVEPAGGSVSLGGDGARTVVFEVRDRYNNPVSGVRVNFSATGADVSQSRATTDERGRASVTVRPGAAGTADVHASFVRDSGYAPEERTDAYVRIETGSGGAGGDASLYDVRWDAERIAGAPGVSYDGSVLTVDRANATFPVDMYATAGDGGDAVEDVAVDFATNDSGVASFASGGDVTDSNGEVSVSMSSGENGRASAYVTGDEDGDRLTVEVVAGGGGGGGDGSGTPEDPGFAYNDTDGDGSYDPDRDSRIPESELADGQYDAGSNQLVVPSTSSDISASNIDFRGDKGVYLGPNVTATAGGATGTIVIDGGGGDVVVAGASLEANGDNADVSLSTNGNIDVRDSTVVGHGDVRLSATGWINASRALLHADKGQSDVILESSGGDVRIEDATLKATRRDRSTTSPQNEVTATVPNDPSRYTIFVENATFVDSDDALDATPDGAANGTPASGRVV